MEGSGSGMSIMSVYLVSILASVSLQLVIRYMSSGSTLDGDSGSDRFDIPTFDYPYTLTCLHFIVTSAAASFFAAKDGEC